MRLEVLNDVDVALHAGPLLGHCLVSGSCLRVSFISSFDELFYFERHMAGVVPHAWSHGADTLEEQSPPDPVVFSRAVVLNLVEINWLHRVLQVLVCNLAAQVSIIVFVPDLVLDQGLVIEKRQHFN